MIMEETRRLREPAAWLLLVLTFVTVVAGIVNMLVGGGLDTFQSRALSASSAFLGIVPVALPFAAVLLATKFGPLLARARLIVIGALCVQGLAALFGLIAWIGGSFGDHTSINLLMSQFLGGALWLALLGLAGFYAITVMRAPELRPAPKPQPQQGFAPHPGYPGGPYQGMQQGPPPGQAGQPGQPGPPPGYGGPQPGYPSGQQAPMPGYQPQEYGQPESTFQMPAVGDPEETHNFGAQQQGQLGYPQPEPGVQPGQPSGPQFGAPGPGPAGTGGQPGWPGGYGQPQSGPQGPAQPGYPGGFGQSGPQQPEPQPYGQGGYGASGGMGAFGHQEPSPYQEPAPYQEAPQYQDPSPYQEPQPGYGQGVQEPSSSGDSSGFDALFGQRAESDSPEDVQRTYRIPHDPETFRKGGYGDQR